VSSGRFVSVAAVVEPASGITSSSSKDDDWAGEWDDDDFVEEEMVDTGKVYDGEGNAAIMWDFGKEDYADNGKYDQVFEEEDIKPKRSLPAEMRYFDSAKINVKGGDGGNGTVAFRREKHVPYGGPNGGNGGDGGNILVVCSGTDKSLRHFRTQVHFKATRGQHGGGSDMQGRTGKDTTVTVPRGTVIRDPEGTVLCEMMTEGEVYVLLEGGRGGRGNGSFKRGNNNAPTMAENGEVGPEKWLDLELKLVADVGIIGVPNAGKSTLLSVLSNAKPKIADYPFTTLVPNLGVYEREGQSTVLADIPGLIEGAHMGLGLGLEFLRHTERTRMLVHLLDATSDDPMGDYDVINDELRMFKEALFVKPQVAVINKTDVLGTEEVVEEMEQEFARRGVPVLKISAVTTAGTKEMMRKILTLLAELPDQMEEPVATNLAVRVQKQKKRGDDRFDDFTVEADQDNRIFYLKGQALERFAQMTCWDYYESIGRFQKVLKACGAQEALENAGVVPGDTVVIGSVNLEWSNSNEQEQMEAFVMEGGNKLKGSRHWPSPARLG